MTDLASGDSPSIGRGRGRGLLALNEKTKGGGPGSPNRNPGTPGNPAGTPSLRKPTPETKAKLVTSEIPKKPEDVVTNLNKVFESELQSKSGSALSVNAKEFVPRNIAMYENQGAQDSSQTNAAYSTADNLVLDQVREILNMLTITPGSFNDYMITLTETLNAWVTDEQTFVEVVNMIFEQALAEPNFRYTGAKVAGYLSEHKSIKVDTGTFRSHMMKRCHQEHQKREEMVSNPAAHPRLHGFTFFLGELYLNMKVKVSGQYQRVAILGTGLKQILLTLLGHPADDNVKCTAQCLKMTGAVLEDDEQAASTKQSITMDDIFAKLKECSLDDNISKHIKQLVISVIELRASDWGRVLSSPLVRSPSPGLGAPASIPFTQTEPVFYDARGHTITRQQAGFGGNEETYEEYDENQIAEYGASNWATADNDYGYFDPSGYQGDPGDMDDEIAAAFEQFLADENDGTAYTGYT